MELVIENLTKNYGSFVALRDVSIHFSEGVYGVFSGIVAAVFLVCGAVCTHFGTANWRRLKKR